MKTHQENTGWIWLAIAAAAVLAVTLGTRLSLGLFVAPLNAATGLGIASISLAMAVNQFVWGAVQPIAGAVADRYGPGRVLVFALIVQSLGLLLTPFMSSGLWLCLILGVLMSTGTGAGAFSVLIGAIAERLPERHRGLSAGIVNAGGSVGQFLFAPLVQNLMMLGSWVFAIWGLAAITLAALPLAYLLKRPAPSDSSASLPEEPRREPLSNVLKKALRDRSYLLLHAGFFTCGFHIAFLVTHLPGEVALCGHHGTVASSTLSIIGFFNIFGSLAAGALVQRYRSKMILAAMYASRALMIVAFMYSPRSAQDFYLFAAGLGFTWLATVPPTASLVSKLFGNRDLSTLFGLTLLTHQIGGFLGAWLGGLALERWHSLTPLWWTDVALAGIAALVNLPIRETAMTRNQALPAPLTQNP